MKLISLFLILILFSCIDHQDDGKTYHQSYKVGSIPNVDDFEALTSRENQIDSMERQYNKITDSLYQLNPTHLKDDVSDKKDFLNNRSRMFMNSYTDGKLIKSDSAFIKGISLPCECYTNKDTMYMHTGVGFFGGIGFTIQITEKQFLSSFYIYTDDVKPFKSNLNDTTYSDFAEAKSKYQYLVLDNKPNFKPGQQLTGYFTFTSKDYYEKMYGDKIDTNFVTAKINFTCKTKDAKMKLH